MLAADAPCTAAITGHLQFSMALMVFWELLILCSNLSLALAGHFAFALGFTKSASRLPISIPAQKFLP